MSKLVWDASGEKQWQTGVSQVALFVMGSSGYETGVAWNGVTAINEAPDGGEANDFYADNIKYASLRSAENYKGSISAYNYPDEFAECDGNLQVVEGLNFGQQARKKFALVYRTEIGNDENDRAGYILHFVWNAGVSPTEKNHETVNENPDLQEFDWDFDCLPVSVTTVDGVKTTASAEANSIKLGTSIMTAIEAMVYGDTNSNPTMPTPDQLAALAGHTPSGVTGTTE